MTRRTRDAAGLLVAAAAAATCVRLGFWQLDRLHQRRARNAEVRARRELPPREVTRALTGDTARDRRLRARGVYDFGRERLWRGRAYDGVPGVAFLTPLRLADGAAVLVDRGWAPSPDAYHVDQSAYREPDTADVLGLGMLAPRARGDVDPAKLRDSLPYPVLSFVLQALPTDRPSVRPPATARESFRDRPIRWPAPAIDDGPHLSYAVQWFSFAVIIVAGSIALIRKTRRPFHLELPPASLRSS